MPTSRREVLRASAALGISSVVKPGSAEATEPVSAADSSPLDRVVAVNDFEELAKSRIPHPAWEYINSGAADEVTLRWNHEAFERIRLNPRFLRDVSHIDTSLELFGQKLEHPVLLAPSALHKNAHPEGELATARGAGKAGAVMVLSTLSNYPVEDVVKAASKPVWFQLYVQKDREFTKHLVQRAEAAGCKALCITIDT